MALQDLRGVPNLSGQLGAYTPEYNSSMFDYLAPQVEKAVNRSTNKRGLGSSGLKNELTMEALTKIISDLNIQGADAARSDRLTKEKRANDREAQREHDKQVMKAQAIGGGTNAATTLAGLYMMGKGKNVAGSSRFAGLMGTLGKTPEFANKLNLPGVGGEYGKLNSLMGNPYSMTQRLTSGLGGYLGSKAGSRTFGGSGGTTGDIAAGAGGLAGMFGANMAGVPGLAPLLSGGGAFLGRGAKSWLKHVFS